MAWPTYCTEPALALEPLLSDKIRTPTDTHACAQTHTSAHTHAHVHTELSLHDEHPRIHSLTGKYICMATQTHALYLSEQILASRCGLIVCQVSILHLCILRFCTQSHKAKKNNSSGVCPNPSWIRCMSHCKCNKTLAARIILQTDVQIFTAISFQGYKQTTWVS